MNLAQKIAILDDDHEIREMLDTGLRNFGFDCVCASTTDELALILRSNTISLLIVDMRLGPANGLDVVRHVSQNYELPIIMISGYGDSTDRAIALEIGADDFVIKPFDLRELAARIRTVLRRSQPKDNPIAMADAADTLPMEKDLTSPSSSVAVAYGDLSIDFQSYRIRDSKDQEVSLSSLEFQIFEILYEHRGAAMSRKEILDALNMNSIEYVDRNIDVLILRLRKKIESNPKHPRLIRTVRNVGYMLAEDTGIGAQ